ncbi:MAG: ATP-binding protein [Patescibacteria group bacterium]|nr:ATP-binding protein [Patescibacteria group bacterium]MDD5121624.1 ATP-binding protein [Patescibacteria group bacterium]MDD5221939.1 ATP-binding protein [Patescibacteria group bacterium]MDD5396212.1 ATP-binding protein [Patescibacteria group bacterium]
MAIRPSAINRATAMPEKKPTPQQKEQVKIVQEKQIKNLLDSEEAYLKGLMSVRDLIAPAALKVNPSFLQLGDKYIRTLFVTAYPRYISVGWFAPVINFNASLDVAMFFYPVNSGVVLKQLQKRVGNIEAELSAERDKGMPRDPIKETALQDIEKLRDDLTTGVEHYFQFALYVTMYANSLKDLDSMTEKIEALFGSKLIYTRQVFYQAEQGFNSTLPLASDELMVTFNMSSSPCASSFPFISADVTSDTGILYGINRHNNGLIIFDRFSMQNANMNVFATSGAGKSYAIKLEVLRSMMFGTDVIIIDPEREYKYLSDAVGGTYVNISLSSDSKINPFDLPRATSADMTAADIIRSAVITIKGLLRIMIGKTDERGTKQFSPEEDSIIDRALLETYAKRDITPSADLSQITEMPTMSDLQNILEGMEGGAQLSERLKKYTEGTFAGLLNNPTNVKVNNQLIVFSVRDLEDELRPIAIYTIVNYIWNIVRSELKKRILVIDEAWWLMQQEDSAKFIYALVKRCRKYYLGVTTITQDVNDFLVSPYGKAIVNNSALQLLLKQAPAAIDLVAQTFMLTEGEKYLLLECGVGEGIFFAGAKHAAIKIIASYSEDQLITSDPRQILEIEQAKREFSQKEAGDAVVDQGGQKEFVKGVGDLEI